MHTHIHIYTLVALITFALLGYHHYQPSPELSYLPKLKLYPLKTSYPFALSSWKSPF